MPVLRPGLLNNRIVIIEDDRDFVDTMDLCLSDAGLPLYAAYYNGDEGYSAIVQNPPDVVLADMRLPLLSGKDILEKAEDDPALTDTSFVVATAQKPPLSEREALEDLGAFRVVSKNDGTPYLVKTVRNALFHHLKTMADGRTGFNSSKMERRMYNRAFQLTQLDPPISTVLGFGDIKSFGAVARERRRAGNRAITLMMRAADKWARGIDVYDWQRRWFRQTGSDLLGGVCHTGDDVTMTFSPERFPDVPIGLLAEFDRMVPTIKADGRPLYEPEEIRSRMVLGKGRIALVATFILGLTSDIVFDRKGKPTGERVPFVSPRHMLGSAMAAYEKLKTLEDSLSPRDQLRRIELGEPLSRYLMLPPAPKGLKEDWSAPLESDDELAEDQIGPEKEEVKNSTSST